MSVEQDIARLERMAAQAADTGNTESLRAIHEALSNAKAELDSSSQSEPADEIPAAGRAKSYALGVQRQAGRYGATIKDVGQLAEKSLKGALGQEVEGQEDIVKTEREKEGVYKQATREHPGFAFGGEMTALLPFAAGRTPAGAFARGAVGGGLTYNEDPISRVTQAVLGGAANQFGYGILGKTRSGNLQSKAARSKMELLPEQRAPTLFPNTIKDFDTYRSAAFRAADRNNKLINREALRTLGEKGERFTDETFENVHKRASNLFNQATGAQDSILLGSRFKGKINSLIDAQETKIVRDAKSIKALQRLLGRVDDTGGALSPKEYQQIRSELTTSIRQVSSKRKALKKTLGDVVEILDNQAELSLAGSNPKALSTFKEARRLWRQYNMFKTEGIVDERTGFVNPARLRRLLRKEDEGGFLLNKDQGELANMLRVDARTPRGRERFDVLGNYSDMRVVGGPGGGMRVGTGVRRAIESPLIGASRLPQRAIEGLPLSATVPAIKDAMPSDSTEKIINALVSGSDEGLSPREKSEVDEKRKLLQESILKSRMRGQENR